MEPEYEYPSRVRLVTVVQEPMVAECVKVREPRTAVEEVQKLLRGKDREHFVVLHLDGKHAMVSAEVVSIGSLSSSIVHPREVFKGAILANAAAIICAHNHPSGEVEPSVEDREVYKRLKDAGVLLGVLLLDFLIVSDSSSWSANEHW